MAATGGARSPHVARGEEAGRDREARAPRRDLFETVRGGGEQERMAHRRAGRRRIQGDPSRAKRGERERHEDVASAVRMVVDADAVEPGVLRPRDDIRHIAQRPPDGHAQINLHADLSRRWTDLSRRWTETPIVSAM
ncbi:MAG TPA: hypothetical protein VGQ77_12390 [Methylomirabilota bacterium]|nr:hypothetical protein [Methylomirabilota bacterium]